MSSWFLQIINYSSLKRKCNTWTILVVNLYESAGVYILSKIVSVPPPPGKPIYFPIFSCFHNMFPKIRKNAKYAPLVGKKLVIWLNIDIYKWENRSFSIQKRVKYITIPLKRGTDKIVSALHLLNFTSSPIRENFHSNYKIYTPLKVECNIM